MKDEISNMTKFIINVNKYMSDMKIKQAYLSAMPGIDKNKISRILKGTQEESGSDMEIIAGGLGKDVGFFLTDYIVTMHPGYYADNKIAFYAGNPSKKQEHVAKKLVELMENIDEIMSAESRFMNLAKD